MKSALASALAILLGVLLWTAAPASAKGSKDPCRKADIKLAQTGQGDRDGDGISDCREAKVLRTMVDDPDTDDDGLEDGDEIEKFCHARKPDTDDDGVEDGDDATPVIEQKLEAVLDALTCPVDVTPGSIGALGITVALDANTEFENKSCEDLATRLALGQMLVVEIEILEDMLGTLTATEVEVARFGRHHGDDDDHDGDDDDDDDDEGEDEDD